MSLPRLLYIGDVSVADTTAGEVLLFRLLQSYPPDRLALVCGVRPDAPQLPGVAYHHWGAAFPRLLHSRIAEEYILWRAWKYYEVPRAIAHIATMFKPDAILTISHVSGWLCAWKLAVDRGIPFYMVVHDDLVYANRFPRWSRGWAERRFGDAYRAARARFCISDTMAEIYEQRFGAPGLVIYPTRGAGQGAADGAPRAARATAALTFAYGGSINTRPQFDQMAAFARIAGAHGHRLIVYTPQYEALRPSAPATPALDLRAPLTPAALARTLRDEADCLLLPQAFDDSERTTATMSFPSKWADYSVIGLPLLVWAPPWSASARFVERHPEAAALVTTPDDGAVAAAIARLAASPSARTALAGGLIAAGRDAFAPDAAWRTFSSALTAL